MEEYFDIMKPLVLVILGITASTLMDTISLGIHIFDLIAKTLAAVSIFYGAVTTIIISRRKLKEYNNTTKNKKL